MTDRPIIFSAPMVRALLEGQKTQTRRVLPDSHPRFPNYNQIRTDVLVFDPAAPTVWYWDGIHDRVGASYPLRYAVGDRLWVREAFSVVFGGGMSVGGDGEWDYIVEYRSGGQIELSYAGHYDSDPYARLADTQIGDWRPSIHMPRWASRLTLIVTDVQVQRLQEISAADARGEGVVHNNAVNRIDGAPLWSVPGTSAGGRHAIAAFSALWDQINGAGAWDANQWVVALTFRTISSNIDSAEAAA